MADQIHMFMLDTLLDTRLSVLSKHYPQYAIDVVKDPETRRSYLNRPNDFFNDVGFVGDEFQQAYKRRNIATLMTALPTMFLFELSALAAGLLDIMSQQPHQAENIIFYINTYPYHDLTEDEIEMILAAISCRLPDVIKVEHIYRSYAQMSPKSLTIEKIDALYLYDFRDWLKCHYHKDTVNESNIELIPGISIHTAAHFEDLDSLKQAAEYQNPNGVTTDPIIGLRMMFSPFFRLEVIRMEVYSYVDQSTIVEEYSNL